MSLLLQSPEPVVREATERPDAASTSVWEWVDLVRSSADPSKALSTVPEQYRYIINRYLNMKVARLEFEEKCREVKHDSTTPQF